MSHQNIESGDSHFVESATETLNADPNVLARAALATEREQFNSEPSPVCGVVFLVGGACHEYPAGAGKRITIGRAESSDMCIADPQMSRHHMTIEVAYQEILLRDFGSTNGTFVNGRRVRLARLKHLDRIIAGTTIIQLLVQTSHGHAP